MLYPPESSNHMTSNSDHTTPVRSTSATGAGHWLRKRPKLMVIIAGLVIAVIWYTSSQTVDPADQTSKAQDDEANATPVVVAPVRKDELDIFLYGLGVVTPLNVVEVGSRVDGQLMSIAFEGGQIVKKGDLLAQIDPTPFEVEDKLAEGQLIRDQSLLDKALVDLKRYRTLLDQDSVSAQQVDTKESLVRQYQAAVKADQSAVTSAKLKLSYAKITAPISGRLGFRQVDAGNIIRASDRKGIVSITQLDPISVIFPVPEDNLPAVMKLLNSGDRIPVEIYDRSLKEKLNEGRLLAVDNQIDATTGTIKLKAEFSNTDGSLFANQFVNVKMAVKTLVDATLIPTAAIRRGVMGDFVYVVKDDQTVAVTPITIGPSQGEITVVEAGLSEGATVVVEGGDRLRDGAMIKVIVRDAPVGDTKSDRSDTQSPPANGDN
jgi:membrane fusion protein, multidrug efflux system